MQIMHDIHFMHTQNVDTQFNWMYCRMHESTCATLVLYLQHHMMYALTHIERTVVNIYIRYVRYAFEKGCPNTAIGYMMYKVQAHNTISIDTV